MDKYIIQSNDNQQFELTVEQVNKYPVLRGTLLDIEALTGIKAEPGSTLYIPFSANLLTIAFNNDYNQPMDLNKIVEVIRLASYLVLEEEVNKLLQTLMSYFKQKFSASQVKMIKYEIGAFDSIMQQLFLSKTSNMATDAILDYHSSYPMTPAANVTDYRPFTSAQVARSSANLDYILSEFTISGTMNNQPTIERNYSMWHKNEMTVAEIPELSEREGARLLRTLRTDFPKDSIYISNDGKYYELEEGAISKSYNIVPLLAPDEPAINTIPTPDYRESSIEKILISMDKSKYMIRYDLLPRNVRRRLKPSVKFLRKTFIGSVAEPHRVVSFDQVGNVFYFSPLFDTIIFLSTHTNIKYKI